MDERADFNEQNINITVPVIIGYDVIGKYLKQKLIGEIISKENSDGKKSNYAQILDVSIDKSQMEGFDLCLEINLQTLTSLFKNKQIKLLFHAPLITVTIERQADAEVYFTRYG